jgi:parvulin-like peptidyl-prolyl isomerase
MNLSSLRPARRALAVLLLAAPYALAVEVVAPPVPPPPPKVASPEAAKEAVATLGELKIPASTVWAIEKSFLADVKKRAPNMLVTPEQRARLRRDIASREIQGALIEKLAQERKLTAPAEEIEKDIESFKKELAERNGMSYEEFLTQAHKTDVEFRRFCGAKAALEKSVSEGVTDAEVQSLLPLRRCSHVLYMYKGSARSQATRSKEEAKKLADEALAKIKADPAFDFGKLAEEVSDCPSGKQAKGDLDFSPRQGGMVEEFAAVLYKIPKVGDYSDVVETPFGYHILKLTALKDLGELKEKLAECRKQAIFGKVAKLIQQEMGEKNEKIKLNEELLSMLPPEPEK